METKNVKLIMMIINDYGYCDGYNENDDAENNYNDDDSDGGTSHADPQFLPQLLLKTLGIPKKFKINLLLRIFNFDLQKHSRHSYQDHLNIINDFIHLCQLLDRNFCVTFSARFHQGLMSPP